MCNYAHATTSSRVRRIGHNMTNTRANFTAGSALSTWSIQLADEIANRLDIKRVIYAVMSHRRAKTAVWERCSLCQHPCFILTVKAAFCWSGCRGKVNLELGVLFLEEAHSFVPTLSAPLV